jgi:hypothetical protein
VRWASPQAHQNHIKVTYWQGENVYPQKPLWATGRTTGKDYVSSSRGKFMRDKYGIKHRFLFSVFKLRVFNQREWFDNVRSYLDTRN